MRIGAPKEIKDNEHRVGLIPSSVAELVQHGHDVIVENGAGIDDVAYRDAGASLCSGPDLIFETAELVVKVKEPQPQERSKLRAGQIRFTYFHLAPDAQQTRDLMQSSAHCIAYETVTHMPGAAPRTSTFALNSATLPFILTIADKGWREALRSDAHLRAGLNISDGKITYTPVGKAHGLPIRRVEEVLGL